LNASKDASPQTVLKKAEELIKLSLEIDYAPGLGAGHYFKGYANYKMSNYVSARYSLIESISIFEKLGDELHIAKSQNIIGQTHYFEKKKKKILKFYGLSLQKLIATMKQLKILPMMN